MIAVAYLFPIIACLLLHFEFEYDGGASAYVWTIILGEATVGGLHWFFYDMHTSKKEYLGSLVDDIVHEESWTELIEVQETKTDSKGNKYTVTRIKEKYHPEKYYFHTSIGSEIKCDSSFYSYVQDLWQAPRHALSWTGKNIKYGERFGSKYERSDLGYGEAENPKNWVTITEPHSYTDKIQCSNSIFKYEKISKEEANELGLYDYPPIVSFDAPCILSHSIGIPKSVDDLFRKFNARYAPQCQMRLYILLFDAAKGISISEKQRAYWQGGNKNEFTVCIGLTESNEVSWARAFSWTDEQSKEVETAQWLMQHPQFDWYEFHDWFRFHVSDWKRKEFKDFDYIKVTLPLWQILTIMAGSVLENAIVLYFAVK